MRADWDWETGSGVRHIVNFGTRGSRGGSLVYDSMTFEHSGLFHIITTVFSSLLEATRAQELTLCLKSIPYGLHSKGSLLWSSYSMLDPIWPRGWLQSSHLKFPVWIPSTKVVWVQFFVLEPLKALFWARPGFSLGNPQWSHAGKSFAPCSPDSEYSTSMTSTKGQAHIPHSAVSNLFQ